MKFIINIRKNFYYKINIIVPIKDLMIQQKKEIIQFRKKITIKGFRKNKVPIEIVKNKYYKEIENNTLNSIINDNIKKIIQEENFNIISKPKVVINQYPNNCDFIYSIYFTSIPDFDYNQLKLIKIKKISIKINNSDIENYINKMRNKHIIWKKKKGPIQSNDKITINYNIQSEKLNNIKNIKENQLTFIINENKILKEITKKILNKYIGDTLYITIYVPTEHPDKNLNNKKITLKITIKEIQFPKKIYSNEQFKKYLKNISHMYNENNLIKNIKKQLKVEYINLEKKHFIHQIIHHLKQKKIIEIPNEIIIKKVQKKQNQINNEYVINNHNILELKYYENIQLKELNNLIKNLFIKLIINKYKIYVTEIEVNNFLNKINQYDNSIINKINFKDRRNNFFKYAYNFILESKIDKVVSELFTVLNQEYNINEFIQDLERYTHPYNN